MCILALDSVIQPDHINTGNIISLLCNYPPYHVMYNDNQTTRLSKPKVISRQLSTNLPNKMNATKPINTYLTQSIFRFKTNTLLKTPSPTPFSIPTMSSFIPSSSTTPQSSSNVINGSKAHVNNLMQNACLNYASATAMQNPPIENKHSSSTR